MQNQAVIGHNLTLMHLQDDMQTNRALILNITERLSNKANRELLQQLGHDISTTIDLLHSMELRVSHLEGNIQVLLKRNITSC